MKIKYILLLMCFTALLSSCVRIYSPALYHQDIAYQPKPASFDTVKRASYISVGLNSYINNLNDAIVSGQANLSRGYVFDNFNLSYGGFVSLGDYQNGSYDTQAANYFKDKFFGAFGGRASINSYIKMDNADFRVIGVEVAYSHEYGDYSGYRKLLQNQSDYNVDPRVDLFTIGLATEMIFHKSNNIGIQHGIRLFLGTTLGHNNLDDTYYKDETSTTRMFRNLFPKASYFIKYKNYFGTAEIGGIAVLLRVGYKF